jgi:hypothetical protein
MTRIDAPRAGEQKRAGGEEPSGDPVEALKVDPRHVRKVELKLADLRHIEWIRSVSTRPPDERPAAGKI